MITKWIVVLGLAFFGGNSQADDYDFDQRDFKKWIGTTGDTELRYTAIGSDFENSITLGIDAVNKAGTDWKVVKVVDYAFGTAFPVIWGEIQISQRPKHSFICQSPRTSTLNLLKIRR